MDDDKQVYRGVVERWNDSRGFGSIRPDDDGPSLFVHASEILTGRGHRTLTAGQQVEFEIEETAKGLRAFNVEVVDYTTAT